MHPDEFIRKNIISMLVADGVEPEIARGGADEAVSWYHRCSQASRKGRMFDDCLHHARLFVRYRAGKPGRQRSGKDRVGSLL